MSDESSFFFPFDLWPKREVQCGKHSRPAYSKALELGQKEIIIHYSYVLPKSNMETIDSSSGILVLFESGQYLESLPHGLPILKKLSRYFSTGSSFKIRVNLRHPLQSLFLYGLLLYNSSVFGYFGKLTTIFGFPSKNFCDDALNKLCKKLHFLNKRSYKPKEARQIIKSPKLQGLSNWTRQ